MSYVITDSRDWKVAIKPDPGETVWVLSEDGDIVVAAYEESGFYRLKLDETVGCLRKSPVSVKAWRYISAP